MPVCFVQVTLSVHENQNSLRHLFEYGIILTSFFTVNHVKLSTI